MKYMVFVIYVITIAQWIDSKPIAKSGMPRGRNFYKLRGIINLLVGFIGMFAVNILLRDRDIIPQTYVWIAFIGFAIISVYGMFCFYKMIVTLEP